MARFVRKEDMGPMEVKVGNESKWICMCGLSSNQPFCDDSHKRTADEEAGKVRSSRFIMILVFFTTFKYRSNLV